MGKMLVYSGPSSPDREDEYNDWYDNGTDDTDGYFSFSTTSSGNITDAPDFNRPLYYLSYQCEIGGGSRNQTALFALQKRCSVSELIPRGADDESRPHNLLVTKQLLCLLSYISISKSGQALFIRTAGSESCIKRYCPDNSHNPHC